MELVTVDCVLDDIATRRIVGSVVWSVDICRGRGASEKRLENITLTRIEI